MYEITLEDLQKELGEYKKSGGHYYFQCKYCLDEHKDNMIYTPSKNLIKCFADDTHSRQLLSEIMKKKHEEKKMSNVEIPKYVRFQEAYIMYQQFCNDMLLGKFNKDWLDYIKKNDVLEEGEEEYYLNLNIASESKEKRDYLKQQRGIKADIIENTGLGFDFFSNKWVIPIYDMSCNLVGFRYRGALFSEKKVWTEKGTPKTLARFYGADTAKTCYCVEGEWDSLIMVQWLLENNQKDFMVVSPSNGASSLLSVMPQLQLNKFEQIKLIMDNDSAGDKATEEVLKTYPMMVDGRGFLKQSGINDINDFYLKKVVKND